MEVLFEHGSCLGEWYQFLPTGVSDSKDTYMYVCMYTYVDTELDDSELGGCRSGLREFRPYQGSAFGGLQDLDDSLMIYYGFKRTKKDVKNEYGKKALRVHLESRCIRSARPIRLHCYTSVPR